MLRKRGLGMSHPQCAERGGPPTPPGVHLAIRPIIAKEPLRVLQLVHKP